MFVHEYRMRHQNPDKSNNFFKQNVFNEKYYKYTNIISIQKIKYYKYTKYSFIWHLGDPYKAHLFGIRISLKDDLFSESEVFAPCNVALSMPTNASSLAVLNYVTLGCRNFCDSFNYTAYIVVQGI